MLDGSDCGGARIDLQSSLRLPRRDCDSMNREGPVNGRQSLE